MLICVYIIGRALFSVNSLAVEMEMLSMQRNIKTKKIPFRLSDYVFFEASGSVTKI